MIKICGDCQQSIRDGEGYQSYPIDSASTAAGAVYFHRRACRKQPYQSTPAVLDGRRRT
ncbi:hypothetical protein [Streptomyces europaeiscabiei]|uniref:hypothetical protein n=1 Tax=Streptomyces europaeiscabiei TaxID=146819 RepID=UPI002E18FC0C